MTNRLSLPSPALLRLLAKTPNGLSASFFLPDRAQGHYRAQGYNRDDQQQKYSVMIHGNPFSNTNL